MSQPGHNPILHEGGTASPPRWRPPPYHDLRIAKLSCVDGYNATARSSAASESAVSRSPSPSVPPSETSNYYAASTSSWATSAGAGTEFGFPNDEDGERCGSKWDDESSHMPFDRPPTPASHVARFTARIPQMSSSRPSSLRNSVCAHGESEGQETDMSESECETAKKSDYDTETSDNDDNDWSGQNGNLESVVIAAVDGDLALAAHLIPMLHRDFSLTIKSKVESWQYTAAQSNDGGSPEGSTEKTMTYVETSPDQSPSMSRKRRRTGSDNKSRRGVGGWDGEEDDGDDEDESKRPEPSGSSGEPYRMLACPFHKRDSVKYGIQHGNSGSMKKHKYRACMGPGFKSIQRLKEHLKRVHTPVQCERCHEIFPGSDRAACLSRLAEHRKKDVSCELGDSSKKEGIDEAQWAALDKQNRKKNQETHRVEKWFEIWDVLFPGVDRPKSPWHDIALPLLSPYSPSSGDAESFANLFLSIMDHKVTQGDLDLSDPQNIRDGVKNVAQLTFRTYISLHGGLAPGTSSGESQNRLSLTAGSSTRLSDPATMASRQLTATTAGTSIVGSHGSPAGRSSTNPYALGSYPMAIPRGMAGQPSFIAAPTMTRVPSSAEMAPPMQPQPLQPNSMPTFGGMNPGDPAGGYYFPYMFSSPQGSWATSGNPVGFPSGHMARMTQDFGMGGNAFFGEQNFGSGPPEAG